MVKLLQRIQALNVCFQQFLILLLRFEKGLHNGWPLVEIDPFLAGHPGILGIDFQFHTFESYLCIDE